MVVALVADMLSRPWMHIGVCRLGPKSVCSQDDDGPAEPFNLGGEQLMESKLLSSSVVPHKAEKTCTWLHFGA